MVFASMPCGMSHKQVDGYSLGLVLERQKVVVYAFARPTTCRSALHVPTGAVEHASLGYLVAASFSAHAYAIAALQAASPGPAWNPGRCPGLRDHDPLGRPDSDAARFANSPTMGVTLSCLGNARDVRTT